MKSLAQLLNESPEFATGDPNLPLQDARSSSDSGRDGVVQAVELSETAAADALLVACAEAMRRVVWASPRQKV